MFLGYPLCFCYSDTPYPSLHLTGDNFSEVSSTQDSGYQEPNQEDSVEGVNPDGEEPADVTLDGAEPAKVNADGADPIGVHLDGADPVGLSLDRDIADDAKEESVEITASTDTVTASTDAVTALTDAVTASTDAVDSSLSTPPAAVELEGAALTSDEVVELDGAALTSDGVVVLPTAGDPPSSPLIEESPLKLEENVVEG